MFDNIKKSPISVTLGVVIVVVVGWLGTNKVIDASSPYIGFIQDTIQTVQKINETAANVIAQIESIQKTIQQIEDKIKLALKLQDELLESMNEAQNHNENIDQPPPDESGAKEIDLITKSNTIEEVKPVPVRIIPRPQLIRRR